MAAIRRSPSWLGTFILRRDFSFVAALSRPAESGAEATAQGGRSRRRKKNLVEVAQFLPNWGVGAKLAKGHWQQGVFYQLTRLQLGKPFDQRAARKLIKTASYVMQDGRHGTAWGIFHDSGAPKTGVEERIGGVNKRVWRYLTEEKHQGKRKIK